MPSATVSMAAPASIATTPASTMSVTCGPTITRPSSRPLRVVWIDFTQPDVSFCITARAFAIHGNVPVATSSPYCFPRLSFGQADAGDLRVGVDRPGNGAVADRGDVSAAFAAATSPSRKAVCASCQRPAQSPTA